MQIIPELSTCLNGSATHLCIPFGFAILNSKLVLFVSFRFCDPQRKNTSGNGQSINRKAWSAGPDQNSAGPLSFVHLLLHSKAWPGGERGHQWTKIPFQLSQESIWMQKSAIVFAIRHKNDPFPHICLLGWTWLLLISPRNLLCSELYCIPLYYCE